LGLGESVNQFHKLTLETGAVEGMKEAHLFIPFPFPVSRFAFSSWPLPSALNDPLAPGARGCVFRRNIIRAPPEAGVDSPQATRAPTLGAQGEGQSVFCGGRRVRKISGQSVRDKWRGPVRQSFSGGRGGGRLCSRRKFFDPGWGDSTSRWAKFCGPSAVLDRAAAYSERRP
jgi:hypothetical protein